MHLKNCPKLPNFGSVRPTGIQSCSSWAAGILPPLTQFSVFSLLPSITHSCPCFFSFMKVCIIILWPRKPCLLIAFGLKSPQYLSAWWALWTLWPEQVFLCFFDAVKVSCIHLTTIPKYNQSICIFPVNNILCFAATYILFSFNQQVCWLVSVWTSNVWVAEASVFLQSVQKSKELKITLFYQPSGQAISLNYLLLSKTNGPAFVWKRIQITKFFS